MIEAESQQLTDMLPDLQAIQFSNTHLLKLINGVLDLAKIEAGKVSVYIEECHVEDLVDNLVITTRPLIEQNRNELNVRYAQPIGWVMTDVTKVRQILLKLLSNAAKFTTDGQITLTVDREQPQSDSHSWLIFMASDTGIGIEESHLTRIFDAFTQVDASDTVPTQGKGLGLTVSYQFAQLMGGSLPVKNTISTGSTFTFRLPVGQATMA